MGKGVVPPTFPDDSIGNRAQLPPAPSVTTLNFSETTSCTPANLYTAILDPSDIPYRPSTHLS